MHVKGWEDGISKYNTHKHINNNNTQNFEISLGFFLNVEHILGARMFQMGLMLGPTRVRFIVGLRPVIAMCSAKSSWARVLRVHRIEVPFQSMECPVT